MSRADDNVELVEKGYAAFSNADLDALAEIMSPDVVQTAPGDNLVTGEYKGRDEVFGFYGKLFDLSDGTFTVELVSTEPKGDDQVIARHHGKATRNGKTVETDSTVVFTFRDGKAVRLDETHDDQAAVDELWA